MGKGDRGVVDGGGPCCVPDSAGREVCDVQAEVILGRSEAGRSKDHGEGVGAGAVGGSQEGRARRSHDPRDLQRGMSRRTNEHVAAPHTTTPPNPSFPQPMPQIQRLGSPPPPPPPLVLTQARFSKSAETRGRGGRTMVCLRDTQKTEPPEAQKPWYQKMRKHRVALFG